MHTVAIKWSSDPDVKPVEYAFATSGEQLGFMRGIEEGCGWMEYTILAFDGEATDFDGG